MDNIENILESILFANGEAVDISDITSKIDVDKSEIKSAVKKLKNKYKEGSGIVLLEFNNKLQFATNSAYADAVAIVLNPIRQRNLSKATLETASIIAYKQPVTRLEIEAIRGVSSDYAINVLLEHGLIEIVGRKDTVGKPALFGTTDEFLKRFNISSIDELPDYEQLLEQVKIIKSGDDRLYNHFEIKESNEDQNQEPTISEEVAIAKVEEKENINKEEFIEESSEDEIFDYDDDDDDEDEDNYEEYDDDDDDDDDWDIL